MDRPESFDHRLDGCTSTPLASYLKALGILRLISSPDNNVTGRAADPHARGWWENECFHLRTVLSSEALQRFFLEEYAPSPIIAPWNGGSGFYPKDNRDGFDPLIGMTVAKRFSAISEAIRSAVVTIKQQGLKEKPTPGDAKKILVAALRAKLPDRALHWLDATLALSGRSLAYPQLLGTGGIDGHLDFTNNFMRRLVARGAAALFDPVSGSPSETARSLLPNALFAAASLGLSGGSPGQFAPGTAGGPNASTGYKAGGEVNPWDFVMMLEGASAFAGAASRRHQGSAASGASFPFTVRAVGAGWGGVDAADEADARAEFWAPLWGRPARFCEIDGLLAEGRAVLNGRTARDGVDFARAAASLGVSRGFSEFERFGFLQRFGKAYLATPLGRRSSASSPGAMLIADLDTGGWLERVRRIGRKQEEPAAARRAIKQLEDAMFGLTTPSPSPDRVQTALVALGRCVEWLAISPSGREGVNAPPPRLSSYWIQRADDGTPEFRVAAAVAGLGLPAPTPVARGAPAGSTDTPALVPTTDAYDDSTASNSPDCMGIGLPMATHFAPVDEARFFQGMSLSRHRAWVAEDAPSTVVWSAGGLVSNLLAVMERRMVEATMRGFQDKPFAGAAWTHAEDIAIFIDGDFEDERCAALVRGLVWAAPAKLQRRKLSATAPSRMPPFAYAALKPIFSTNAALRRVGALDGAARMPVPPGLLTRLRAAGRSMDGSMIGEAVRTALDRARSSGLRSPFDLATAHRGAAIGAGTRAHRLAASLLIPIDDRDLSALLSRAYSSAVRDDETPMEDTNDVA